MESIVDRFDISIEEILRRAGEYQRRKAQGVSKAGPPRAGLVPQSGDPEHPVRWIRSREEKKPKASVPSSFRQDSWAMTFDELDSQYPRVEGGVVDGRTVREGVPNRESIGASMDTPTELPGIREVPMSVFEAPPTVDERTKALADAIRESGEISPLIVVVDSEGPYILEGSHRYDALKILGAKAIPAKVVLDEDSLFEAVKQAVSEGRSVPAGVLAEYSGLLKSVPVFKGLVDSDSAKDRLEQAVTPKRLKRVKVAGSRKPGYAKGTAAEQRNFLRWLRQQHVAGTGALVSALNAAGVGLSLDQALQVIENAFSSWTDEVVGEGPRAATDLYRVGFKAGAAEFGATFSPDKADVNAVNFLATEPNGVVPTLQHFIEEERAAVEKVIRKAFEGGPELFDLDAVVGRLQERVAKQQWRLERIVRTETSKIVGMGRLAVWEADPNRDMYLYSWVPTLDGRHKDVSRLFGEGGPYTFEKVRAIWINPVATVRNRKTGKVEQQDDRFNNRCTLVRTPKSRAQLIEEGRITEEEQEAFWDGQVFTPVAVK